MRFPHARPGPGPQQPFCPSFCWAAAECSPPRRHTPPPALPVAAPSVLAVGEICYGDLPSEAHDTLDLIEQGGPFPFEQDGTVFQNREGILPDQSTGYYHEYTVITPGSPPAAPAGSSPVRSTRRTTTPPTTTPRSTWSTTPADRAAGREASGDGRVRR